MKKAIETAIQYRTENEMMYELKFLCESWVRRGEWYTTHKKWIKTEGKYKFNKALAKRILQEKYARVIVGSNHGYLESDFDRFLEDYLKASKQK